MSVDSKMFFTCSKKKLNLPWYFILGENEKFYDVSFTAREYTNGIKTAQIPQLSPFPHISNMYLQR